MSLKWEDPWPPPPAERAMQSLRSSRREPARLQGKFSAAYLTKQAARRRAARRQQKRSRRTNVRYSL